MSLGKSASEVVGAGDATEWASPRERWASLIQWGIIISVGLMDLILARIAGISLSLPMRVVETSAAIVGVWPFTAIFTRLSGFAVGCEVIAENLAKLLLFSFFACALSYYLAINPAPLHDALMVEIDRFLGFSWQDFFGSVGSHPALARSFGYLYVILVPEALLLLLFIGAIYPRRPSLFISTYFFSLLITIWAFALFPVAGPFVYYQHLDMPGAHYVEHYMAMRSGALTTIPLYDLRGIVSFPSFHVSSALIIVYFLRGLPVVFPLAVIANAGMSVAALYVGGHYLSDALGGLVVGLATIAFTQWLEGATAERRRPLWKKQIAVANA